jgi:methyl-accepting chemotaxis protein PixJ
MTTQHNAPSKNLNSKLKNSQTQSSKLLSQKISLFSLQTKATLLAMLLGTVPVVAIGGLAYTVANRALTREVINQERDTAKAIAEKINRYMFERYGDIQVIANLPIVNSPQATSNFSVAQKQQILTDYARTYGMYNSIAIYDLQGRLIMQSEGETRLSIAGTPEFLQVLQTRERVITEPQPTVNNQGLAVMLLAPVRQPGTGQIIAIAQSQMPISFLDELVDNFKDETKDYGIINKKGEFFIDSTNKFIGKNLDESLLAFLPPFKAARAAGISTGIDLGTNPLTKEREIVAYENFGQLQGLPPLGWKAIATDDVTNAFQLQRQLALTLGLGTLLTLLSVSALAAILAFRATRPIKDAAQTVAQIGQGDLEARLKVSGGDELAILGANINGMASQIKQLLDDQKAETERIEEARQEARQEADARAAEQQQQKEFLQKRALELLLEVDPVSKGDLTIRANVTPDEIGTIADSYNAIIRNLRQIVQQVQDASQAVTSTTQDNEVSVNQVVAEAGKQAKVILGALHQVQMMAKSSQGVSEKALEAEAQVQAASAVVQAGDEAMNRTVQGISAIRETVSETAKKVKRLGEASQKISKVVNLIGDFAAQTNLLALNAAIEAARAGEEGRGFGVVAEEVRALAQQSASATADIEQLVEEIQMQTSEVVMAMESGTEQVVVGTQLVQESRQKLTQISQASLQINQLIQEIAQAANSQTQASNTVSRTMQTVASTVSETSKQSEAVAQSFGQLLEVAQALQVSVSQFKVS